MRQLITTVIIMGWLLMLVSHATLQSNDPLPIPDALPAFGIWSGDSQWYGFIDLSNRLEPSQPLGSDGLGDLSPFFQYMAWENFNVLTDEYRVDFAWRGQPALTAAEMDMFATEDVIRTSPEGSLMLYARNRQPNQWTFELANRNTRDRVDTQIITGATTLLPTVAVYWSESSDLVVGYPNAVGVSLIWHIDIVNPLNLGETVIQDIRSLRLGDLEYVIDSAFTDILRDIDSTGQLVLLTASEYSLVDPNPQFQNRLIIWDIEHPEQSQAVPDLNGLRVLAAAFAPEPYSSSHIVYLVETGDIHLHTLGSHQDQVLTHIDLPEPFLIFPPQFSPNGQQLAYFNDFNKFDILDVALLIRP